MIDLRSLLAAIEETTAMLDAACVRSGRPPGSALIVVAGKYVDAEDASVLPHAGVRVIGENRLQDLEAKVRVLGDSVVFDFIGHLQRRKVKDVLPLVRLIHSVDRMDLIDEIGRRAEAPTRVLLQVNPAGEAGKGGFAFAELDAAVARASRVGIVVGGLMGLPPLATDSEASRPWFRLMREARDRLARDWGPEHDLTDLSMGTSQDAVVAVEEGATMVRIGRGIVNRTRMEQP
ncbi:MAG: YggS family pyridoxal phosphate enzyme [Thermoleophilia bacterium]|nr:YggS family pyridoxal phosphate enzyme [Thermoleophilia bacterium]